MSTKINSNLKTKTNKPILYIFIWISILILIGLIYLYINYINVGGTSKSLNFQGLGDSSFKPITFDKYIQDIDDTDIDKALDLAIKRHIDNNESNLGDYEQLMYIYLDKADYNQVITLGLKALKLIKESGVTEEGIINTINSQLVQGYLYNGDLDKAKKIIIGNKYLEKSLERYMYEYKSGKYDFIVNSKDDINNLIYNERGYGLILLAKSYSKLGSDLQELEVYKDIYLLGKSLEGQDSLFETYYSYASTLILLEKYKDNLSQEEYNNFLNENNKYKELIYSNSKIQYTESETSIFYNKDLMYFNIERIINF